MAEWRRPFWQWLAILLLNEIALVGLLLPKPTLERLHAREMRLLSAQMGNEAPELLGNWADQWFKQAFVDTGVVEGSERFFERKENPRDPFDDRGFGNWMQKRVEVTWLALRYGLYRWGLLLIWLPLLLAAMAPVTLDALCRRDIRKYRFSYSSPLVHHNAKRLLWVVIMLVVFLPLLPLSVPPMAIPVGLSMGLMGWWVYLANLQKRL